MYRIIKTRVGKFIILGALTGTLIGLVAAFFMDYIVVCYSTQIFLTYSDWVIVSVPVFALIGAVINAVYAFLVTEPEEKGFMKILKKNN